MAFNIFCFLISLICAIVVLGGGDPPVISIILCTFGLLLTSAALAIKIKEKYL